MREDAVMARFQTSSSRARRRIRSRYYRIESKRGRHGQSSRLSNTRLGHETGRPCEDKDYSGYGQEADGEIIE